jgi:hypothetical protein
MRSPAQLKPLKLPWTDPGHQNHPIMADTCDKMHSDEWHLEQLVKFYQDCFGDQPTTRQLAGAVMFVSKFTRHAHQVHHNLVSGSVAWDLLMLRCLDPIDLAVYLARYRMPMDPPATAALYFET